MFRTNTPEQVLQSGYINVDAGEGVNVQVPGPSVSTGLRRITDLVADRTAGDVYVWREGKMVFLQFTGLMFEAQGFPVVNAIVIPEGFRPKLNIIDPTPLHVSESEPQYDPRNDDLIFPRTIYGTNGTVRFFGPDPAVSIYFSISYMTDDPAPATLPGVAA